MYDPSIHHRRSIRLSSYDYTQPGLYFVTVCVQDRASLLGQIAGGQMQASAAGQMVQVAWDQLPTRYPGVGIDEFAIMPNHVHGILILNQTDPEAASLSLSAVMQRWKSWTTALYRHGVHEENWPPFSTRLRQRNYHERIVRNEQEWRTVREYIVNNPACWQSDDDYAP